MKNDYKEELRLIRSLLIVTSLQRKEDLKAKDSIIKFENPLDWKPLDSLMIDKEAWNYIVEHKSYNPKLVFCHPDVLMYDAKTSLYYRGLTGLSQKAAKDYIGAIENLEKGTKSKTLLKEKATKIARTYNFYICSIIKNSTDWTLENGYRTIIATLGISLDGTMRNKIGEIAEERIKALLLEWLSSTELLDAPYSSTEPVPSSIQLKHDILMKFSSEPDVAFYKDNELLAVIEIKGGTDPAGALERYGAATKSFQHSIQTSRRCKNFYLAAVFTEELDRRINDDRLVEKSFDIIDILDDPETRKQFFNEIFHHVLRMV